jgi:hypothetical protein
MMVASFYLRSLVVCIRQMPHRLHQLHTRLTAFAGKQFAILLKKRACREAALIAPACRTVCGARMDLEIPGTGEGAAGTGMREREQAETDVQKTAARFTAERVSPGWTMQEVTLTTVQIAEQLGDRINPVPGLSDPVGLGGSPAAAR